MSFNFGDLFQTLGIGNGGGPGGGGSVSGLGGTDWMGKMEGEAQEGIQNSLKTAAMSKELSMAQALGKFMKANGDACKSMAP